jgi:transposase-like protein
MKEFTKEELAEMQLKFAEQFRTGQSVFGKGGALAPLFKEFLETALESELDAHLDEQERSSGNKRNGHKSKRVKTSQGELSISTPQDRKSSFDPQIVKKRERILADSLEDKIIGMYSLGMSYRDIGAHIEDMYDMQISPSVMSEITDRIIPKIKAWQSRPLDAVYTIVWLDAMHYKAREDHQVKTRAVYNVIGVDTKGYKDVLGSYISESEGANFWLGVLTDLNNRGVKDILIACTDNLKGFSEAILSIFPQSEVQTCIIHQIRNSLKYVLSKDQKEFMADLKTVYKAVNKQTAEDQLLWLEEKWGKKYPAVIDSWNNNWEKLSTYFEYAEPIRKIIYTTNTVEGYHRQIRKYTKTKGAFTSDMALMKMIYLTTMRITKKWSSPLQNWALTIQQLKIKFGERIKLDFES